MLTEKITEALRALPGNELKKVVQEASLLLAQKQTPDKPQYNALQPLLLKGPVMTDEQYKAFLESRKLFNDNNL